ncbi:MAG: asparagine synthase (glutamine-hydrolyzing) [Flavobacteriales bacterium]|nr:asparagine synthase (glutamine-hydrolyzing) [Flavobacteriales bacterium]
MCGINGVCGLKSDNAESILSNMNAALAHRGPDNDGSWFGPEMALGHRRLSIIDLSDAGNQPMLSSDENLVLVYNGELYNHLQLRKELTEYAFKTNSDTEVILAAFIKWGIDCIKKFNGMFSFAIYDKANDELFVTRDRLGIKPLYYYYHNNQLVFSSEIKALLSSGLVPRKLNKDGLIDYLKYQTVHSPATIIENVKSLKAGHYLVYKAGALKENRYWKPEVNQSTENYETICGDIKEQLFQSVEKRMMADVSYGAFLSGGIDSSIIVGLMSQVSSKPVKTFAVVFDEEDFSEAKYSDLIAAKFKTDHCQINLKLNDFMDDLPVAMDAMDHPSGDGPNTFVVSKATKKAGVTMALSGLGGDELFAGYHIFNRMLKVESNAWLNMIPARLRSLAGSIVAGSKSSIATEKIKELLSLDEINFKSAYPLAREVLSEKQIAGLINKDLIKAGVEYQNIIESIHDDYPLLSKVSIAEIGTYMQHVLLRDTDQMSMQHSLEVRVPFLDHELVEYVLNVPDKFKVPHSPKKLLTDSIGDLLPSEIINRPKMGFTFPWDKWLRADLKSYCEERLTHLKQTAYFNEHGVDELWNKFLNKDPHVTWARIWILVVLGNWMTVNNIE